MQPEDERIHVDVALYGELAKLAGGQHIAQTAIELERGAVIRDLLEKLGVQEKGYLFINAVLCDMPGLSASLAEPLAERDHVGIFSLGYMWPYQYRDGAHVSESLKAAMQEHGAMHHSYTSGS